MLFCRLPRRTGLLVLAGLVLSLVPARRAHAGDDPQGCYDAYEQAQVKKREGDPRKARDLSRLCSRDSCPAFLRADCVAWMEEAEKAVPTVVLQAQTDEGDASAARVLLDGVEVTTRLDGRSIELDPGSHVLRFELGTIPREVRVVIKEGEKSRAVVADFRSPHKANGPVPAKERPVPLPVWIATGASAAGLMGFGAFAVAGSVAKGALQTECAPFCTDAQTSTSRSLFLAADVALGVGLAGAATAVTIYLLRPEVQAPSDAPRSPGQAFRALPVLSPSQQGMAVAGSF